MAAVTERPIRVARVIARMNVGGPALLVTTLTEDLPNDLFEQRLFIGNVGPGEDDYLELHGISLEATVVPGLGRSVRPFDDLRAFWFLCKEFRRFRPDIVDTHTAKAGVLGRLAARVTGGRRVQVVHTFHGHLLNGYFRPGIRTAVVWVERLLARMSNRLVSVGASVRDELLAAGIGRRDQYQVVPPAVPVLSAPIDRAPARAALQLDSDRPIVAFVGRLTHIKRPDRLIEAMSLVCAELPDAQLVIAGDGDLFEDTKAQARSLGDQVLFLGFRSDVQTILAAADVVVLTSDNEGMPVSLIEAAACGRACVTTDVGSAKEVVLDHVTGLVVEKDAAAVARALLAILGDATMRDGFEQAAVSHARQCFSRERLSSDMAGIYESLVRPGDLQR